MILQRPARSAWTGIWLLDIFRAPVIFQADIDSDPRLNAIGAFIFEIVAILDRSKGGGARHHASRRGAGACRRKLCRIMQEAAYGEHDGASVQLEQRPDHARSDTSGSTRVFMLVETHMGYAELTASTASRSITRCAVVMSRD